MRPTGLSARLSSTARRLRSKPRGSDPFPTLSPFRRNLSTLTALSTPCISLSNSLRSAAYFKHAQQFQFSTYRRYCSSQNEVAPSQAIQKAPGRELLLSPPALVVTREYEWANIIIGFEQANRYTIRAAPGGEVVGFLAEVGSISSSFV